MALSFDFSPKNGPNSHSQIVKKFCDGFHVDSAIELARIIRERMAAKGYVPAIFWKCTGAAAKAGM